MRLAGRNFLLTVGLILTLVTLAGAQNVTRDLKLSAEATVEIINRSGRVGVRAVPASNEAVGGKLIASSDKAITDAEIKISGSGGKIAVTVAPSDTKKRIDLSLEVPERTRIIIETDEGSVEAIGNFAAVTARTGTGTITTDVPDDDIKYNLAWTESRPRYLADFTIADPKEKSAGRFEIKGKTGEGEKKRKGEGEIKKDTSEGDGSSTVEGPVRKPKTEDQKPKTVTLNFTTARGIVLLNVPPNEVMSDLKERPLTNAAKAIVRSGDSFLMEAIRRAAPKYYGDYSRSLRPFERVPTFAPRSFQAANPNAKVKTALVRVTDIKNRAIAGLTENDFEISENGVAREIVSVTRSTAPFNLVLLLDVSGSVDNYVNFIRKAARNFVETVDARDRVSLVIFNDDVKVLSKFTTDKGALSESLDTFDAGGGTAYYDALAYTVADTLRPLRGERTAIVILTDGDDNRSFLAFDSLLSSIQESGALIYPLYVPSDLIALAAQGTDIDPMRKKYMSLTAKSEGEGDRLAKMSGGIYYPIKQIAEIQQAYEDIVVQLRSAYNVTFKSDVVDTNGPSPRLKIKSKREGAYATVNSIVAVS